MWVCKMMPFLLSPPHASFPYTAPSTLFLVLRRAQETRSVFVSCAAAVAAKLTDRPVRLTLGRDVDMSITGGRHAFLAHYTASAVLSDDGTTATLRALDVMLYNNGGSAFDLSGPVMDRALFHVDGCYHWPLFRAEGVPCRTVQPPNTAFRGFGGPQGMAICEHVMDHLATACGVSGDVLRRDNMYQNGQTAPFGMIVGGEQCNGSWNVPTMWDRLHQELDMPTRRFQVEEFNSRNRWVKRGLACIPVKFGIAFTAKFMNQGGALVHLYTDGTILVTHGGTEMGQGLHTKVGKSLELSIFVTPVPSSSEFDYSPLTTPLYALEKSLYKRFVKSRRKLLASASRMSISTTPVPTRSPTRSPQQRAPQPTCMGWLHWTLAARS